VEPKPVTALLRDWREGDRSAFDQLVPLVYQELYKLASHYLRGERPDHTFRPTDLVSEAYVRLCGAQPPEWADRVHFFGIAARTMRQILVDHARARGAIKRGGAEPSLPLHDGMAAPERSADLLALDDALEALAKFDERKAKVIELHYFAGLSQADIAALLTVHVNTVTRDLRLGEAWLQKHMAESGL